MAKTSIHHDNKHPQLHSYSFMPIYQNQMMDRIERHVLGGLFPSIGLDGIRFDKDMKALYHH